MARPFKLAKYTQEEVRQKVVEFGGLKGAAEFYGCAENTLSRKIGNFTVRGVKPSDEKEIRELLKIHTKNKVAELMGYSVNQLEWFTKRNKLKCSAKGKPTASSSLTYYEMHNMDKVVKQYDNVSDCAYNLGVCDKTVYRWLKHAKNRKAAHSNNQAG